MTYFKIAHAQTFSTVKYTIVINSRSDRDVRFSSFTFDNHARSTGNCHLIAVNHRLIGHCWIHQSLKARSLNPHVLRFDTIFDSCLALVKLLIISITGTIFSARRRIHIPLCILFIRREVDFLLLREELRV